MLYHPSPNPRILIVDDEKDVCEGLKHRLLRLMPHVAITFAHCGDDAVDALVDAAEQKQPIDVVVLDMWLPLHEPAGKVNVEAGRQVINLLELMRRYQLAQLKARIFIFTAHPEWDDAVFCIQHGAEDYLDKFDAKRDTTSILIQRIEAVLKSNREPSSAQRAMRKVIESSNGAYGGKWIAAITDGAWKAAKVQLNSVEQADGFHIISLDSYDEIRTFILSNKVLRWQDIPFEEIPDEPEFSLRGTEI